MENILKISKYEGLHLAAEGFSEEVKPFWPTDFKRFWYEGLSLLKPRLKDYWSGLDNIINGGNNTTQHSSNTNTTIDPLNQYFIKVCQTFALLLEKWRCHERMHRVQGRMQTLMVDVIVMVMVMVIIVIILIILKYHHCHYEDHLADEKIEYGRQNSSPTL